LVKQFLPEGNPIGQSVRSAMLKIDQPDFLQAQAPMTGWKSSAWSATRAMMARPSRKTRSLPALQLRVAARCCSNRTRERKSGSRHSGGETALRELNPELAVSQDHTLAWWLETQGWGQGRFIATLFSLFALLALALAAAGLYSVVSFSVTQRTQEVGIRMALGAPRGNILRLVISSTAAMLATGVAVGLVLSLALDRIVRAWAGGSPRDPLTLLGSAVILLLVATIACIVPAWRAATVNPVVALRYE